MSFGLTAAAAAVGITEGNFTKWTNQWIVNRYGDDNSTSGDAFLWNGSESVLMFFDAVYAFNPFVINISNGAGTQLSTSGTAVGQWNQYLIASSIYGKYHVVQDQNTLKYIYIFKDGVLVQTIDMTTIFPATSGGTAVIYMSPTGKYLVLEWGASSPTLWHVALFKGS